LATKRLGRYHDLPHINNNVKSGLQSYFSELASLYNDNSKKLSLDWSNHPIHKRASLQKVLANANKAMEKSTKFIDEIKSRQLVCASRTKSIPANATI
jgi:hypothetical protein